MKVHVRRYVSNLATVHGDFISEHAWSWNLDTVGPVEVVVAESVGKVQNGILRYLGGVGGHVEVGRFNRSLSNRVWNQEKVEGAVNNFSLLDETVIHISSLWRVCDGGVATHLEESLPNSLVYNDEGVFGEYWVLLPVDAVLLLYDLVELLKLVVDYLCSHRVSNSVSVDENVVRKLTMVVLSEGLEGTLEVSLENDGADDLLPLLFLWACLCIIFAHVFIVGCTESNDALLSFVANVNTNKHSLSGDLLPKV